MPVRRSSYMYNIPFGKCDQFTVIPECFNAPYHRPVHPVQLYVTGIYVANSYRAGAGIFKMPTPHRTHTHNGFGKRIAGCQVSGTTQYMSRHNSKCRQGAPSEFFRNRRLELFCFCFILIKEKF